MEHYDLLDHQAGRCDYDPYDRYDAEWHDEGLNFGHLFSEGVPASYQEEDEMIEDPPEDDDGENWDTDLVENYEDID